MPRRKLVGNLSDNINDLWSIMLGAAWSHESRLEHLLRLRLAKTVSPNDAPIKFALV